MPERVSVDPRSVTPTRFQPFTFKGLNALDSIFREGKHQELDPVIFVRSRSNSRSLLYDGNHRLMKAYQYGVTIPGNIYQIGEYYTIEGLPRIVDKLTLAVSRISEELAIKYGLESYAHFPETTEEPELSDKVFAEFLYKYFQLSR